MPMFYVQMPIAGLVSRAVEAENKEDAIEKFYEIEFDAVKDEWEWDYYPKMLNGNVRNFSYDTVEVEEIEDL